MVRFKNEDINNNIIDKVKNLSKAKNVKKLAKYKKQKLKVNRIFEIGFFITKIRLAFI